MAGGARAPPRGGGPKDERRPNRGTPEEDRAARRTLTRKSVLSEVLPAADAGDRRSWEWAWLELSAHPAKDMRRWLLLRRDPEDPDDLGFYQAYGPEGTSVEELIEVCQDRWAIEDCFAEAKGEVGLDHYEVRCWETWHRYLTLCLLAHAFLRVVRLGGRREEDVGKKGISNPA